MGALDKAFRSIAENLTDIFTDDTALISIVESYYDSTNDETTTIRREESVKLTPPTPVNSGQLTRDETLLSTDQVVYAPAKVLEAITPTFDPRPGSDTNVYIRLQGRDHSVVRVLDWKSGDQTALIEFVLRS
jgi:hypothetical protein